jgi:hypothetical protein
MSDDNRIAEVIEAGTTLFTAQCYELYGIPTLGSLVKTGEKVSEIYAIVASAVTTGLEPGRRSIARGQNEASEEDIYKANPQLLKLLRSEFGALVLGYRDGGRICHCLPPRPARIHGFVYACSPDEVRAFSQGVAFLNVIVNSRTDVPTDELLIACLRQIALSYADREAFLMAAGRELAVLLAGRYDQFKSVLGRLR